MSPLPNGDDAATLALDVHDARHSDDDDANVGVSCRSTCLFQTKSSIVWKRKTKKPETSTRSNKSSSTK